MWCQTLRSDKSVEFRRSDFSELKDRFFLFREVSLFSLKNKPLQELRGIPQKSKTVKHYKHTGTRPPKKPASEEELACKEEN